MDFFKNINPTLQNFLKSPEKRLFEGAEKRSLERIQNIHESENTFKLVNQIIRKAQDRTKKDIQKWKTALMEAEHPENAKQHRLQYIYTDALLDNHLSAIISSRNLMTTASKFKVVDEISGETDELATNLLRRPWFYRFMKISLNTKFSGPTVAELSEVDSNGEILSIYEIPRTNYRPRSGVIVKEITDDTKRGISINDPEYENWLVPLGDHMELGLLHKAVPQAILKRNAQQAWSEFIEIFGMPLRWATHGSRDKSIRDEIATMLQTMGQAAYGVFPEGTEIEFVSDKKADAYEVYKQFINVSNSELSKLFYGQTMTSDDGSSRSQAEVHMEVAESYIASDSMELEFDINMKLFPKLIIHGYPLENKRFAWDREKSIDPQDRIKIDESISRWMGYSPSKQYLESTYNIDLEDVDDGAVNYRDISREIKDLYTD